MALRKRWKKGKLTISAPEKIVHTAHGSHDEITERVHGLPPEWIAILRENGVVEEDLVWPLPQKSKSNSFYGNGIFNMSNSSLLSNNSLKKLWRTVSGKRESHHVDEEGEAGGALSSPTIDEHNLSQSRHSASYSTRQVDSSLTPLEELSPTFVHSSPESKQPTVVQTANTYENGDVLARECGLPLHHRDYQEINHGLLEVIDSLGHGSLGVVEEVRVSSGYSSFVRKRVQIPYYRREQYLKIINQEAHVLQSLSHCHIVKMIGSYSEIPGSGRQFYSLLMAPVGQRDLRTFLDMVGDQPSNQGPGWVEDRKTWLRHWFKCLASALAYMHSKGVRHQDIKPSNIIHRRSAVYFTDFSSASQFEIGHTTSTENPARTSAMYAAPEVIDNGELLNRHGRATDVFALGAVFTEMLAIVRGKSIDEYHRFLTKPGNGKRQNDPNAPMTRQAFLYGRKLQEIDTFYGEDEFYQGCVAPMLRSDRERRPEAKDVATRIRNFEPWTSQGCACDITAS